MRDSHRTKPHKQKIKLFVRTTHCHLKMFTKILRDIFDLYVLLKAFYLDGFLNDSGSPLVSASRFSNSFKSLCRLKRINRYSDYFTYSENDLCTHGLIGAGISGPTPSQSSHGPSNGFFPVKGTVLRDRFRKC